MKLKILHTIASMDSNCGGTTTALYDLLKEESKFVDLQLFTVFSENQIEINLKNFELVSEKSTFLDYSEKLRQMLNKSDADLFHGHAIWNLPIHQMCVAARRANKPYIISIHGMLEPWSLQQSNLKKRLAMNMYQRKDLKMASCIHATAEDEANNIRNLGYNNPIAVIPNGIDLSDYPLKSFINDKKKKKILFLSRVHHKKGIENLIDSWLKLSLEVRKKWEIEIAGNGAEEYIQTLRAKISDFNLQDEIFITGPKFGVEKIETYHSADLFVLPTYSENFGMVVAEALACGIPVITTKGTPWKDLEECNAGSWIDIGVNNLHTELEIYLRKDSAELEAMGRRGRMLIEDKYSIESVGKKFVDLYSWILNRKEKPDFVKYN